MNDIPERRRDIEKRIKKHKAQGLILEAEMEGLQLECDHPNLKKWTSGCYDGSTDHHLKCDDCGFQRTT